MKKERFIPYLSQTKKNSDNLNFCIKEMMSINIMLISTILTRFMCNIAKHYEK